MGIIKDLRDLLVEFKNLKIEVEELKAAHQAAESSLSSEQLEEQKKAEEEENKERIKKLHEALQGRSPVLRTIRQRARRDKQRSPLGTDPATDPNYFNPFAD